MERTQFFKKKFGSSLAHSSLTTFFRASRFFGLFWSTAIAVRTQMCSIGLRSGEFAGHSVGERKEGTFSSNHATVFLALCGGAPSCWKVQFSGSRNNNLVTHFSVLVVVRPRMSATMRGVLYCTREIKRRRTRKDTKREQIRDLLHPPLLRNEDNPSESSGSSSGFPLAPK